MTKRKRIWIIALLLLVALSATGYWFVTTARGLSVAVREVSVKLSAQNDADILAQLEVTNSFPLPVRYFQASYQVKAGDKNLLSGDLQLEGDIAAKEKILVELPIRVNIGQLRDTLQQNAAKKAELEIAGELYANTPWKKYAIPFSFRRALPVKKRQDIVYHIESVDARWRDKTISLQVVMRLVNPSDKKIAMLRADFSVSSAGEELFRGQVKSPKGLPSRGEGRLEIPLSIDIEALRSLRENREGNTTLKIEGDLQAHIGLAGHKKISVPFVIEKELPPRSEQLDITVSQCKIRQRQDERIEIAAVLQVAGKFPAKIDKGVVVYRVDLGVQRVVQGKIKVAVAHRGEKLWLKLPVEIDPAKIKSIKKSQKETMLRLYGRAKLSINGKIVELPFELTRQMMFPDQQRKVKVLACNIALADESNVKLGLRLQVSPAPEKLKKLLAAYRIDLAGKSIAQGKARVQYSTKAKAMVVDIPLLLDKKKLEATKAVHIGKVVMLTIRGKLLADMERRLEIPFHFEKEVPLRGKPFVVESKTIRIVNFAPDALDLHVELGVVSQFPRDISKIEVHYQAMADGEKILHGQIQVNQLPASGRGQIQIPLHLEKATWDEIKKKHAGKNLKVVISGKVAAQIGDKNIAMPFQVEKQIVVREKPFETKLKKFRIRKFRLRGSTYYVVLSIKSLMPSKIEDLKVEGEITISDKIKVEVLNDKLTLLPGETTELELEVKAQRFGLVKLVSSMIKQKLTNGKLRLRLTGRSEEGTNIESRNDEDSSVAVEESEE